MNEDSSQSAVLPLAELHGAEVSSRPALIGAAASTPHKRLRDDAAAACSDGACKAASKRRPPRLVIPALHVQDAFDSAGVGAAARRAPDVSAAASPSVALAPCMHACLQLGSATQLGARRGACAGKQPVCLASPVSEVEGEAAALLIEGLGDSEDGSPLSAATAEFAHLTKAAADTYEDTTQRPATPSRRRGAVPLLPTCSVGRGSYCGLGVTPAIRQLSTPRSVHRMLSLDGGEAAAASCGTPRLLAAAGCCGAGAATAGLHSWLTSMELALAERRLCQETPGRARAAGAFACAAPCAPPRMAAPHCAGLASAAFVSMGLLAPVACTSQPPAASPEAPLVGCCAAVPDELRSLAPQLAVDGVLSPLQWLQ